MLATFTQKHKQALRVFEEAGGTLRTSEARAQGVHPRTLYHLRDTGHLERLSRGLYRLADRPASEHEDLVIVAGRVPEAVVTLISALAFHDLTDEIPRAVHIALPRGKRFPRLDYPPLETVHVSEPAFSTGIETRALAGGLDVRVYDPARTVADCFKFRGQIGKDVALGALKTYLRRSGRDLQALMRYADVCRVKSVMRPHVESLL
jgi:predicted transcriptional regulator of viral defense system